MVLGSGKEGAPLLEIRTECRKLIFNINSRSFLGIPMKIA